MAILGNCWLFICSHNFQTGSQFICCCTVHCRRVAVTLPSCLPLPLLLLRCHRTVHCCPSPLPLRCRHAIASPSSPLPMLSLSPPPPPPAFADPFIGWLLRCCPLSAFVIACCHLTIDALVASRFCRQLSSTAATTTTAAAAAGAAGPPPPPPPPPWSTSPSYIDK